MNTTKDVEEKKETVKERPPIQQMLGWLGDITFADVESATALSEFIGRAREGDKSTPLLIVSGMPGSKKWPVATVACDDIAGEDELPDMGCLIDVRGNGKVIAQLDLIKTREHREEVEDLIAAIFSENPTYEGKPLNYLVIVNRTYLPLSPAQERRALRVALRPAA